MFETEKIIKVRTFKIFAQKRLFSSYDCLVNPKYLSKPGK